MRGLMLLCVVLTALLPPGMALAQAAQDSGDTLATEDIANIVGSGVYSMFLSIETPVPAMQPKLTNLKRSWRPDTEQLIQMFLGSRESVVKEEAVESPTWGSGRRYKSGTVIYLMDKDMGVPQDISGMATEVEVVPSFLDIYSTGFAYVNNIPHTAVYATDVKITSEISADVSYYNTYDVDEGQRAAEQLIAQQFGELQAPAGFQPAVSAIIQDFGERLFAYLARLEYITDYDVYEFENPEDPSSSRRVIGTQPVSVPIWDVKVQMMLDGDKLLAGLEYFWDDTVHPVGEPQECINANDAITAAREALWQYYEGQPPLLTVQNVSLGYIQDRSDRTTLIPVWLFDAWYTQAVTMDPENMTDAPPLTSPYARNVVSIPLTFAINALTSELNVL